MWIEIFLSLFALYHCVNPGYDASRELKKEMNKLRLKLFFCRYKPIL